jgi:uncharacterized protein
MKERNFSEVTKKIRSVKFRERFDMVVGIGRGGVVPAYILARCLGAELDFIRIKFRDDDNRVCFKKPRLMKKISFDFEGKRVLLVDDRSKTGKTLEFARSLFAKAGSVKTFAVNGKADYSAYDEDCFLLPWNA